jgi:hypothetical protein
VERSEKNLEETQPFNTQEVADALSKDKDEEAPEEDTPAPGL